MLRSSGASAPTDQFRNGWPGWFPKTIHFGKKRPQSCPQDQYRRGRAKVKSYPENSLDHFHDSRVPVGHDCYLVIYGRHRFRPIFFITPLRGRVSAANVVY